MKDGIIKVGYMWSPIEAGKAFVTVANMVLDGKQITDGMEIPGLGKVSVDPKTRVIRVIKMVAINKDTIDELVGARTLGLLLTFCVAPRPAGRGTKWQIWRLPPEAWTRRAGKRVRFHRNARHQQALRRSARA